MHRRRDLGGAAYEVAQELVCKVVVYRIIPPVDRLLGATLEWEMEGPVNWLRHMFEFHPLSDVSQTIE